MLTLLAFPKPFCEHINLIQRNAIGSWSRLRPECEIILFGDEEGTAEVAKEFGLLHISEVARNECGTPLLSDVFEKGKQLAMHDLLCYVNCDIILKRDFLPAVKRVSEWNRRFLMVGECWDLDVAEVLASNTFTSEQDIDDLLRLNGQPRGPESVDYFVFPRELYRPLPPFVLGRAWFDQWLIWQARNLNAAVVDATAVVRAVHQNHDYLHVSGGKFYTQRGVEAIQNLKLAGGVRHCYRITEASHKLLPNQIKRNWRGYFGQETNVMMEGFFQSVIDLTQPFRHPLGLRMGNLKRVKAWMMQERS